MKITVFDTYIAMGDEEGYPDINEALVEKLDEMLNTYGITHAFTLPSESTLIKQPNAALALHYDSKDGIEVELICALFYRVYRKVESERLAKTLVKIASHYITV